MKALPINDYKTRTKRESAKEPQRVKVGLTVSYLYVTTTEGCGY